VAGDFSVQNQEVYPAGITLQPPHLSYAEECGDDLRCTLCKTVLNEPVWQSYCGCRWHRICFEQVRYELALETSLTFDKSLGLPKLFLFKLRCSQKPKCPFDGDTLDSQMVVNRSVFLLTNTQMLKGCFIGLERSVC
jgi:hypothetical protein